MFRRRFMHLTGVAPVHNRAQSPGGSGRATVHHPTTHSDRRAPRRSPAPSTTRERRPTVATTPVLVGSAESAPSESGAPAPPPQPLWRFALTGLGPLGLLCIFALLAAVSDHVG